MHQLKDYNNSNTGSHQHSFKKWLHEDWVKLTMVYYSNHPSQYKNRKSFAQSNYSHSSIQDYYYSLRFAIQYRLVLLANDTAAVFIVYSKLAIKPKTFLLHLILNTTYLVFTFHHLFTSNPNLSSNPISRLQVFTIALTQWVMEVQRNGAMSKLHKGW